MKPLPRGFVIAVLSVLAPLGGAHGEIVDAVIASVDTEVILYSEVMAEIQQEIATVRRNASSSEEFNRRAEELMRGTLEQAIEGKILLREALLIGVEAGDDVVESRIDSLRQLYETNEEFLRDLESAGETLRDYRERVRKQILAQRMAVGRLRAFEQEVVVSEAEVQAFYDEHEDEFIRPERVRVSQIFLKTGNDPTQRARARARLQMIRDELLAGAGFGELAIVHSQAPGAEEGGIIGWQLRGDLVPALEEAVFSTPAGGVTEILESSGGVHLMHVDDRQEAGLASLNEVRTEIEPVLRKQAAEEHYVKWLRDLRKRSRVRIFL